MTKGVHADAFSSASFLPTNRSQAEAAARKARSWMTRWFRARRSGDFQPLVLAMGGWSEGLRAPRFGTKREGSGEAAVTPLLRERRFPEAIAG